MSGTESNKKIVSRAVYDPPIREAIAAGDIDQMRSLLKVAKKIHKDQGDLKSAIARLEDAIKAAG